MTPPGSLLGALAEHLRSRRLLLLGVAIVAIVLRLAAPSPPTRSVDAVASMLGAAVGGQVRAEDFIWEERGGLLHDALIGRRVLFLAALPAGPGGVSTHDLFRAEVRLTRSGRPVAIRRVVNLTETPRGDEQELVAQGRFVAYATRVGEAVEAITVLDLGGDGPLWQAQTRSERLRAWIENWLGTGALRGIGRLEVGFGAPPAEARFELGPDALVMALGPQATPAAVSLPDGALNPGPQDPSGLRAVRLPHPVTPWTRFLEDVSRAAFGPGTAASVRVALHRLQSASVRARESLGTRPAELPPAPPSIEPPQADDWPPPRVPAAGGRAVPGEGIWLPPPAAFPPPSSAPDAPPLFFETVLRPDPARPHTAVRLVVMDGRRLELRLVPGTLAPQAETGLHGSGRIPEADLGRAVAVFEGGAPEPATLGAVYDRRALIFPRQGAPTLAVERLGRPLLGSWPFGAEVPASISSLRQAPVALVEAGRPVPSASEGDGWLMERSALCVTESGHLIYGWAADVPASALATALAQAGCRDAVPLATSPDPVGLGFVHLADGKPEARPLVPAMSFAPAQAFSGSPTEFVYVVVRDGRPDAPLPEGATWAPDGGRQPAPAWMPAVHAATVSKLGVQVRLTMFAPGRFAWRVRSGTKEIVTRSGGALPGTLEEGEQARAAVAVGLGTGKRKAARGLAIGGAVGLRFSPDAGVLVLAGGRARIERSESWTQPPAADTGVDAVELPLTAEEGRPLPEARVVGSMRARGALCVREDGAVVVATTTFDTDEATTEALVDLGCARVVALDRGSHHGVFMHRAGTDTAPEARYEVTALYGVELPMRGGAGRFEAP
jgi:hypothetical protein